MVADKHNSNEIAFRRIVVHGKNIGEGKDVREAELKNLFKEHDRNGDGVLDKKELKAAFKRLGSILPDWRVYRGLSHADSNRDGVISDDEFSQLVKYALGCGYKVI